MTTATAATAIIRVCLLAVIGVPHVDIGFTNHERDVGLARSFSVSVCGNATSSDRPQASTRSPDRVCPICLSGRAFSGL